MKMKCCKCLSKMLEILIYLAVGYFCGGCSNTGTCVLHANVLNACDPALFNSNNNTNNPTIKE